MSEQKIKKPYKVQPKICNWCGAHKGVVSKYRLNICRRCFKDYAEELGFRKYN